MVVLLDLMAQMIMRLFNISSFDITNAITVEAWDKKISFPRWNYA
jgi:hypothetical protein